MEASTPVAVGGVGGSGTRLIAQCLRELGYFVGSDLNESNDNLLFTLLFKRDEILESTDEEFRELLSIFYRGMLGEGELSPSQVARLKALAKTSRNRLSVEWLQDRVIALLQKNKNTGSMGGRGYWGWKEPSTHVVLDRLLDIIPGMKYIHVVRNGLDMAYSENQNQLAWWGSHFLGEEIELSPRCSLKYWCAVHRRVLNIGESMGANFLLLNYDEFCTGGDSGIKQLYDFLAVDDDRAVVQSQLLGLIDTPDSIGRYKNQDISVFDKKDVQYVEQLGFDTTR